MRITIIYNVPAYSRHIGGREQEAVDGVLVEVDAVEKALTALGHHITRLGMVMPLTETREMLSTLNTDIVFNLFEGFGGFPESEPDIAFILEELLLTFTGCPSRALRLALKKSELKKILAAGGIPVPKSCKLSQDSIETFDLSFPCIVKPDNEDASHGITRESVVNDMESLKKQAKNMAEAHGYPDVLVEEYIEGREFNATVIGNNEPEVLEISEIRFELPESMPKILTYAGKWDKDSIEYKGTIPVCPPDITGEIRKQINDVAIESFRLTGCRGYARVDLRMDIKGAVYVLEVNPNPDISPDSGAALQAKTAGMDYTSFVGKIVSLATEASK